jgi:hypothetical protein
MTITNYATKSNDIIFFERGYGLKAEDSKYCIFGIDFNEVASYSIEETTWKDDSPAISIFITLEKEKEYILMRKTSNPEKFLNKIINPDKIEGFITEYSAEYQEMMPKYGKVDPDVDLKYIFDLLIYG